jgi:hypothetical protein
MNKRNLVVYELVGYDDFDEEVNFGLYATATLAAEQAKFESDRNHLGFHIFPRIVNCL